MNNASPTNHVSSPLSNADLLFGKMDKMESNVGKKERPVTRFIKGFNSKYYI
jgi:hypothetical protein